MKLKLIDFGVSTKYMRTDPTSKEKVHIKHRTTGNFYGNYAFASPNAHQKNVLTRRDDFHCVLYFLSYLLTSKLLFFANEHDNFDNTVEEAAEMKLNQQPHEFLTDPRNKCLIPLAEYIYSIGFEEEPNYNKIKFLITKNILDIDMVPNFKYDWNLELYSSYIEQKDVPTELSRDSMDVRMLKAVQEIDEEIDEARAPKKMIFKTLRYISTCNKS